MIFGERGGAEAPQWDLLVRMLQIENPLPELLGTRSRLEPLMSVL
jgi:hypothetical protein